MNQRMGAVILTREPEDNAPLADALRARGIPVVELPCVATRYVDSSSLRTRLFQAFENASTTSHVDRSGGPGREISQPQRTDAQALPDGLIFTSRRGVRGLLGWFPQAQGRHLVPGIRVFAVGKATAAELIRHECPVSAIAEPPDGATLAALVQQQLPAPARLMLVRGNLQAGTLEPPLLQAGYLLEHQIVYENVVPSISSLTPFPVASVFVASPSAVERLLAINPWLQNQHFLAIGHTTAQACRQHGISRVESVGADPAQWEISLIRAANVPTAEEVS